MNYLAHALLAGPDPQWVLGSYLGDHVRGTAWRDYPDAVARGIVLHRKIDVFTDQHPAFRRGRRRLEPAYRRYGGILLDMFFDHFLARQFAALTGRHLPLFACTCYATIEIHSHLLPQSLARFASYQYEHNLLVNYASEHTLSRSLAGIATRMRRPGPLASGLQQLHANREGFEADFAALWQDLTVYARSERARIAALPAV